jgi:hypothetical protein
VPRSRPPRLLVRKSHVDMFRGNLIKAETALAEQRAKNQ